MDRAHHPTCAALAAALLLTAGGCATTARRPADEDQLEHLRRSITKVQFAIGKTKVLIAKAREAEYLPDLYMRLAELYVEQARYHYHLDAGGRPVEGGVESVPAQVLKTRAVSAYRRLLQLFPDYPAADKVRFFMAHELRELGEFERMARVYRELAEKHPRSPYRVEGLLILGDHHFDKGDLDGAERHYRMVVEAPETRAHAMARYKLAWCRINRADFKGALGLLEGSVDAARKWLVRYGGPRGEGARVDLRREALIDAVYPFTEVRPAKSALKYFRRRADSKSTYLAALAKLGNRYYIKGNWPATAMVYRELLALSGDSADAVEHGQRLYEAVTSGALHEEAATDVEALIRVVRRRHLDAGLSADERNKLQQTFEKATRDLATRLHALARDRKEERLFAAAARAYTSYLSFYGGAEHAAAMRANLAGALFAARRYMEAGLYFELASMTSKGDQLRDATHAAVAAYYEFLRVRRRPRKQLLRVIRARAGLRRAGRRFIKHFPRDQRVVQVKFNIAKTHHDAGEFDEAIRLFTALVEHYPTSKEARVAAHLVLTAYRTLDDDEGLITAGRALGAVKRLGDEAFKKELAEIVKGAQERLWGKKLVSGKLDDLLGTDLECRALMGKVEVAETRADARQIMAEGEKLAARCPDEPRLPKVLALMGKTALEAHQLERGASHLEAAARRHSGAKAAPLYLAAGEVRAALGQRQEADRDLAVLLGLPHPAPAKAALAVGVARLHLGARDWPSAIGALQRAPTTDATRALLGHALLRQGELEAAAKALAPVVQRKSTSPDVASARYALGEVVFAAGFSAEPAVQSLEQLNAVLKQLLGAIAQARQVMVGVVATKDATWSVAALGRLSAMEAHAARTLRELPLPAGLSPTQVRDLRAAIEKHAGPLEREARVMRTQCAGTARRLLVVSAAARACLAGSSPAKIIDVGARPSRAPGGRPERLLRRPGDLAAATRLGARYLGAGRVHLARAVLAKVVAAGDSAARRNLLAVALFRLGEHQVALAQLERALSQQPGLAAARLNRAALLARFGHAAASRAELGKLRGARRLRSGEAGLIPGALELIDSSRQR
jgi:tetratricopeptide (TPR) repeat protein